MKQTKTVSGTIRPEDNADPFDSQPADPVDPAAPAAPAPTTEAPPPYPVKLVPAPAKDAPAEETDQTPAPASDPAPEGEKPADAVDPNASPIPNLSKDDFDNIQKEFAEAGKLGPEAYKKLAAAGYSKTFVDMMIQNQVAAMAYTQQQLYAAVGDAKTWEETYVPWAVENLTAEQREALNAELTSGDVKRQAAAIAQVKQFREDALGKAPSVVLQGRKPAPQGVKPFSGPEAYQAAISDPRWFQRDPEYMAKVRQRAAASKAAGIRLT